MYARPWTKYDRLLDKNRRLYTRLFESGPPLLDKVIRWTLFANWLTGEDLPPPPDQTARRPMARRKLPLQDPP